MYLPKAPRALNVSTLATGVTTAGADTGKAKRPQEALTSLLMTLGAPRPPAPPGFRSPLKRATLALTGPAGLVVAATGG
jgi:hypothetical protein